MFRAAVVKAIVAGALASLLATLGSPAGPASAADFVHGAGVRSGDALDEVLDLAGEGPFAVRVPVRWSAGPEELDARVALIRDVAARSGWIPHVSLRYQPPEDVPLHERPEAFAGWIESIVQSLVDVPNVSYDVTNRTNAYGSDSDAGRIGATSALVEGVRAAKRVAGSSARVGFSWLASGDVVTDAAWWASLATTAGPEFRHAVDFVDVQLFPGSASRSRPWALGGPRAWTVETLGQARTLFLPMVGLDASVEIWVGEYGAGAMKHPAPVYGEVEDVDAALRTEHMQARTLAAVADALTDHASTYNVSGAVWSSLVDDGCPLGVCEGLVTEEGRRRLAFGELCSRVSISAGTTHPCLTS